MTITEIKRMAKLFAEQTDRHGNLVHPHFEEVREIMGALMEWHPRLAAMPTSNSQMELAYQLAMRTFATEDETNAMIAKATGGAA